MSLLEVRDLHTTFPTPAGVVRACDGVSFEVGAGEVLGIVGESGSGKTIAALSVLGLVPPPGRIEQSSVRLNGEELVGAPEKRLRQIRGRQIGMIFQDAGRALDPVHTIGSHLKEAAGRGAGPVDLLARVGLSRDIAGRYPHQLSGGQRQRAMIAVAIARNPPLVIADEPTTAVDSVTQIQVLRELVRIRGELGCALIVISHNMGLISRIADRVAVMYLGRIVEQNSVAGFALRPLHPYSRALLAATPSLEGGERLTSIPGTPARMTEVPAGCAFHPRCPHVAAECEIDRPHLRDFGDRTSAACHLLGGQIPATGGGVRP
jgi:oligopeptide/dipeptide ABC transporter ATP-binding protein